MFSKKYLKYKITKYLRTILCSKREDIEFTHCKKFNQLCLTLCISAHVRLVYIYIKL